MSKQPVLTVKNLTIAFETDEGLIEITDRVSFEILPGEIFGLVGESGCGKTITALSILRLLPQPGTKIISGSILLRDRNILSLSLEQMRGIRGKEITMIFQEPAASLNPLLPVKKQLLELFDYHQVPGNHEKRVMELLNRVGFPDPKRILAAYPHELSGGMLQRVMIAIALMLSPSLIIADEPTTALDVTVQAQIMELLIEMQRELGSSILFITHNFSLIAQYANCLAVMYAGRIVEESGLDAFLAKQLHPYSQGLIKALPDLHSEHPQLKPIPGQVPQPKDYSFGCRFRERCDKAFELCTDKPELVTISKAQKVACFLHKEEV